MVYGFKMFQDFRQYFALLVCLKVIIFLSPSVYGQYVPFGFTSSPEKFCKNLDQSTCTGNGTTCEWNPNLTPGCHKKNEINCVDTRNNKFTNTSVNYGSETGLWIHGYSSGGFSYLKFNLTEVPPSLQPAASVKMGLTLLVNSTTVSSKQIELRRITSTWSELTLTGTSFPTINGTAEAGALFSIIPGAAVPIEYIIDITNIFNNWINNTYVNYGLIIQPSSMTWGAGNDSAFASRENPTQNYRPFLWIDGHFYRCK